MVGIVGCDLNKDNMITTADYALYSKSVGLTISDEKFDVGYDFNRDNMVTTADYALYSRFVGYSVTDIVYAEMCILD